MNSTNFNLDVRPSDPLYYPKEYGYNISRDVYKNTNKDSVNVQTSRPVPTEYDLTWQKYVDRIPYSQTPKDVDQKYVFSKDIVKDKELKKDLDDTSKIKDVEIDPDDPENIEDNLTYKIAKESLDNIPLGEYQSIFQEEDAASDNGKMTSQKVGDTPEHGLTKKQLKKKKKDDEEDEISIEKR
jgi:hypothetical protein